MPREMEREFSVERKGFAFSSWLIGEASAQCAEIPPSQSANKVPLCALRLGARENASHGIRGGVGILAVKGNFYQNRKLSLQVGMENL